MDVWFKSPRDTRSYNVSFNVDTWPNVKEGHELHVRIDGTTHILQIEEWMKEFCVPANHHGPRKRNYVIVPWNKKSKLYINNTRTRKMLASLNKILEDHVHM